MHDDASLPPPFSSTPIVDGLIGQVMALAINLDRQTGIRAIEVENIGAHRVLAAEPQSVEFAPAQRKPQGDLGRSQFAPQGPCALNGQLGRIYGLSVRGDWLVV
jgi:hypothetical protein